MALPNWQKTITNESGDVIPNAEIHVVDEATGLDADLFEDRDGNTELDNPFFTDSDGFAQFYADAGVYRVTAEAPAGTRTWRYETLLDQLVDNHFAEKQTFDGGVDVSGAETHSGEESHSGDVDYTGALTKSDEEVSTRRFTMEEKYGLGDIVQSSSYKEPSAWDEDNPRDYWAGLCIDAIDTETTISEDNWPDLVPLLRSQKAVYRRGHTEEESEFDVTNWDVTSNVATLTFADDDGENAVLAAEADDQLIHESYTNWHPVTLPDAIGNIPAGDYAITDVDPLNRQIQFAVTASDGSGAVSAVAEFRPHRIPGSTTTAREYQVSGRAVVSQGDADGHYISGLRRRDEMQQITGTIGGATASPFFNTVDVSGAVSLVGVGTVARPAYSSNPNTSRADFDSADSPSARTGDNTNPRALAAHTYKWGVRYIAT